MSFDWNSIRLGGPAHGIVTKTVYKTLPGEVGVKGEGDGRVGGWESRGRVVGSRGGDGGMKRLGCIGNKGWGDGGQRGGGVKGVVEVKGWWRSSVGIGHQGSGVVRLLPPLPIHSYYLHALDPYI